MAVSIIQGYGMPQSLNPRMLKVRAMTADDLAELDRLLAKYQAAMSRTNFIAKGKARKPLETALVRHASELIKARKVLANGCDVWPLSKMAGG